MVVAVAVEVAVASLIDAATGVLIDGSACARGDSNRMTAALFVVAVVTG